MKTKKCSDCKEIKNVSEFSSNSARNDGLHNLCKDCNKNRVNAYNAKNIVVLSSDEAMQQNPWLFPETLATKYGKDKEFIDRGLLACKNAGVHQDYFINRYLKGDRTIPFNADVDYQSRIIQGLIRE